VDLKTGLDVLKILVFVRIRTANCANYFLIITSTRFFSFIRKDFFFFVSTFYHQNEPAEDLSTHN
jgi:hypothetical protein